MDTEVPVDETPEDPACCAPWLRLAALGLLSVVGVAVGLWLLPVGLQRDLVAAPLAPAFGESHAEPTEDQGVAAAEPCVRFTTAPVGASVFVNGRLVGATPIVLHGLEPGTYSVRFELAGRQSCTLRVAVAGKPLEVTQTLALLATGKLVVDFLPRGAEVFLNREWAGLTPLTLDAVPVGPYEVLIRKTNFEPFAQRTEIEAGQTALFKDTLRDKILEMLQSQLVNEPQRVAHYIDLAHYHFIAGRLDAAADLFIKAEEVSNVPLMLHDELDPDERTLELRLRGEDRTRLKRELQKHRDPKYFEMTVTRAFSEKYESALLANRDKHIGVWAWVEATAKDFIRTGDSTRAEMLYVGHLEKTSTGPSVLPCTLELLKVRLSLRNVEAIQQAFARLLPLAKVHPAVLFEAGKALSNARDKVRAAERDGLLKLAETALRQALEQTPAGRLHAEMCLELGQVLLSRTCPAEAVPFYEQALQGDLPELVREDRSCGLAEALRQADRIPEARELFTRLAKSAHPGTRVRAEAGLTMVGSPKDSEK